MWYTPLWYAWQHNLASASHFDWNIRVHAQCSIVSYPVLSLPLFPVCQWGTDTAALDANCAPERPDTILYTHWTLGRRWWCVLLGYCTRVPGRPSSNIPERCFSRMWVTHSISLSSATNNRAVCCTLPSLHPPNALYHIDIWNHYRTSLLLLDCRLWPSKEILTQLKQQSAFFACEYAPCLQRTPASSLIIPSLLHVTLQCLAYNVTVHEVSHYFSKSQLCRLIILDFVYRIWHRRQFGYKAWNLVSW